VVIWVLVQNATWTPIAWHHPIWAMAAEALDHPVFGSISVNRDLTTVALIRLITAASVFWVAAQLCQNARRADWMMAAIVVIAVGYAGLGLVVSSASGPLHGTPILQGVLPWFYRDGHDYSVYIGMGLVVVCGLLLRLYQYDMTIVGGSLRFRLASIIESTAQKGAVLMGCGFLLVVALVFSASFSCTAATALGLTVLMALTLLRPRKRDLARHEIRIQWLLLAALLVITGIFLELTNSLLGRIDQEGVVGESRLAVSSIALRAILDSPWLGYGYGTFADVFGMFRDRSISPQGFWNTAHDVYLELFQGLGVIAGALLIICVIILVAKCLIGSRRRHRAAAIPAMAVSVACLIGVDALVSSALHRQTIALTFMALLGAGIAQCKSQGRSSAISGDGGRM
jgi:O-antigen ligase